MTMTYYRIDTLAAGATPANGVTAMCGSLIDALAGLRSVRTSVLDTTAEWARQVGTATERALSLFEQHVDTMMHQIPSANPGLGRLSRADRELIAEHAAIRQSLIAQLSVARSEAILGPAAAIRLLDMTVDSECLLALHINGLVATVREEPSSAPHTTLERAGSPPSAPKIGVKV